MFWWLRLAFLSMSNLTTAGLFFQAALPSAVSPSCSSGGGSTAHMRSGGAGGGRAGSERERATRAGAPHPPPRAGVGSRVSERRRRRGGAERRDARRERAWRRRARRRRRRRRHGRACTSAARPHTRARRHAAQGGRRTELVDSMLAPSSSSLRASSTLPFSAALRRAFPLSAIARDACGTGGDARRGVSALGGARRSLGGGGGTRGGEGRAAAAGCSLKRSHGAPAHAAAHHRTPSPRADVTTSDARPRRDAQRNSRGSQSPVWLGEAERRRRLRGRCSRGGAQHWTALRRARRGGMCADDAWPARCERCAPALSPSEATPTAGTTERP